MTWKEKMKEFGGGNFTFLSTDGETLTFIVVGEPVLLKSMYKKQEQERIGCPVVTDEGYQLFICGKRLARKLSKHEAVFDSSAIMVIRHGVEGDQNARYDVRVLPEPDTFARLKTIKDAEFKPELIQESVEEFIQVLGE
jgi:hypothetical protein